MPEPGDCPHELQMDAFVAGMPLWAKAQTLWDKAKAASQSDECELAVSLLTEFLALPVEVGWQLDARLNRGRCFMRLGRHPEALADFHQVVEQGSVASEQTRLARTMSASVHLQMGDRRRAIAALEAALESRDPALSDDLRGRILACIAELVQSEAGIVPAEDKTPESTEHGPGANPRLESGAGEKGFE